MRRSLSALGRAACSVLLLSTLGSTSLSSAQASLVDAGTDAAVGRVRIGDRLANGNIVGVSPQLIRKPNGSFGFMGNGFDATIERDGSVHMRDKFVSARFRLRSFPINEHDWVVTFW